MLPEVDVVEQFRSSDNTLAEVIAWLGISPELQAAAEAQFGTFTLCRDIAGIPSQAYDVAISRVVFPEGSGSRPLNPIESSKLGGLRRV